MRQTLKYFIKFWQLIIVVFALLFAQAMFDLMLPDYMSKIVSQGVAESNISLIWRYGFIMLAYSFGVTACSISVGYIASVIGSKASMNLRASVFSKVTDFSGAEFDKFNVSTLITRSTNDITQVQQFSIMFIRIVLFSPMMAIGGIIKAVEKSSGMNYLIWVIVAAIAALLVTILTLLMIAQPKFMKLQRLTDNVNLVAREGLNGMMVIRAFNTAQYETERFDSANKDLTKTNLFINKVVAMFFPAINIIMYGVMIAVVWIAALSASGVTEVANMMAFMQYAMQIIMSFMMMTMIFIMMPRAIVSAKRIGEVLNTDISINESPRVKHFANGRAKGYIQFENVSFAYPNSAEKVLDNVSFSVSPGETVAIIGSTGSGKTTLIALLPRLYDITEGSLKIDGIDIKELALHELRENIAYIPQKNSLFSGTIETNIKYANQAADNSDMKKAAQIAQAEEFIQSMEEEYSATVAQGGDNFSGGQKQRLSIARALIKKSPIYVFDDSFSALDFKTDSALRKELKQHLTSSAILIVAQRVGTIMNADKIIVLDSGKVVGMGTHASLMQECAVYQDIANSQLSKEELGL